VNIKLNSTRHLTSPISVAVLSDIHIGGVLDEEDLQNVVDKTNAINAGMFSLNFTK
jgi:hypothetical protein